jgi:predicted PurR-regulated permease PerM
VQSLPDARTAEPGLTVRKIAIIAAAALAGALLLLLIIAIVLALVTNIEQSSAVIRTIRDIMIIFLALQGVLIILALAILIVQIARLIAIVTTEIKPILENTQDTLKTAQGTVQFLSETVASPIVRTGGLLASFSAFTREAFGLRRAVGKMKGRR